MSSLQQARILPKFFQTVPIIVETYQDMNLDQFAIMITDTLKLPLGKSIPSMNMIALNIPNDMIDILATLRDVKSISLDRQHYGFVEVPNIIPARIKGVFLPMDGIIPTSDTFKKVNGNILHGMGYYGSGIRCAVLDTGVDLLHPQVKARATKLSTMKVQPTGDDENGHGTHCITTVFGLEYQDPFTGLIAKGGAPMCDMTSIKVLGLGIGTGMTSDIMEAIEVAVRGGNKVISMSLGSEGSPDEENDPMVRMINEYAILYPDVIFVIAAGNSGAGPNTIGIPGCAEKALTVGSWGIIDNQPAYFSSRGPTQHAGRIKPDICAPGGGRARSDLRPKENIWSGTAFGSVLDPQGDYLENGFCAIAGTCLTGDSLVYTNPKGPTPIKDLKPSNIVLSFDHKTGRLTKNRVKSLLCNGTKKTYKMSAGGKTIKCTDNHPLLTVSTKENTYYRASENLSKRIKKRRKELKITQKGISELLHIPLSTYQCFEDRQHGMSESIIYTTLGFLNLTYTAGDLKKSDTRTQFNGLKWKQLKDLSVGDSIVTIKELPMTMKPITEYDGIPIADDMAQMFGFMIGDGWLSHNISRKHQSWQVCIAEHRNAPNAAYKNEKYTNLFESVFGKKMKLISNGRWYYCFSKEIWKKLQTLGLDKGAKEKTVPQWIFQSSKSIQMAFIKGYLDADGHKKKSIRGYALESASEDLIRNLHELFIMNGFHTSRITDRKRILQPPGSPKPIQSHTWQFTAGETKVKKGSDRIRCTTPEIDPNQFALSAISHIEPLGEEMVYDIEVENAHNFIADGIVVHNSMATPVVAYIMVLWKEILPGLTSDMAKVIFKQMSGQQKNTTDGYGLIDATWIMNV